MSPRSGCWWELDKGLDGAETVLITVLGVVLDADGTQNGLTNESRCDFVGQVGAILLGGVESRVNQKTDAVFPLESVTFFDGFLCGLKRVVVFEDVTNADGLATGGGQGSGGSELNHKVATRLVGVVFHRKVLDDQRVIARWDQGIGGVMAGDVDAEVEQRLV